MGNELWPLTLQELNIADGVDQILIEDINSYAWPEGCRARYTEAGWEKAKRRGFAILHINEYKNRHTQETTKT